MSAVLWKMFLPLSLQRNPTPGSLPSPSPSRLPQVRSTYRQLQALDAPPQRTLACAPARTLSAPSPMGTPPLPLLKARSRDLGAEPNSDGAAAPPGPPKPGLYVVKTALLGTFSALLEKRLVANTHLRLSFARSWTPILHVVCTVAGDTAGGRDASGSGRKGAWDGLDAQESGSEEGGGGNGGVPALPAGSVASLLGEPLSESERGVILTGFNELVLTLPASEQHSVYSNWFRIAYSSHGAGYTPLPPPSPSILSGPPITPRSPTPGQSLISPQLSRLISEGSLNMSMKVNLSMMEGANWEGVLASMGAGAAASSSGSGGSGNQGGSGGGNGRGGWFSLSMAYRKWLKRLGSTWDSDGVANAPAPC